MAGAAAAFIAPFQSWALTADARAELPQARAAGAARLTFWGFDVYDASLWVTPAFRQAGFADHAFALELAYLRAFSSADLARRSIEEMRRLAPLGDGQAAQWQKALEEALPDVQKGDRITGVHRPGQGVLFFANGRRSGEIRDAQLARLFFSIWLGPQTSEPRLREALLAGTPP